MRRSVPEPWATAMIQAGVTDPRYTDPRPSMSRLAQAVGVHATTIGGLIFAERDTDQHIVEAVARELKVPVATVMEWVGRAEANPYQPPSNASLMTDEERRLVDGIIRRFTRGRAERHDIERDTLIAQVKTGAPATESTRLTPAELKGELRATTRRLKELVDTGRRLDPDEQDLVLLLTQKITRLEAALHPADSDPGHVEQTGS